MSNANKIEQYNKFSRIHLFYQLTTNIFFIHRSTHLNLSHYFEENLNYLIISVANFY